MPCIANAGYWRTPNPLRAFRQECNRFPLFGEFRMAVDIHRQPDIGMPSHRLRRLGRDSRQAQIGNERVPVRMEIGEPLLTVLILQIIRVLTFNAGFLVLGFLQPSDAGGGEINPHHFGCLAFKATCSRSDRQEHVRGFPALLIEPGGDPAGQLGMQDLCISTTAFAVQGLDSHRGRISRQIEGLTSQAANLAFAEARPRGEEVHHRSIRPCDPLHGFPDFSGCDEARQFIR